MSERDPSQRVVITGMGVAANTPNGLSVEGFWGDLVSGRHAIRLIPDIIGGYQADIETRLGAPLAAFNLHEALDHVGFEIRLPKIYNIYKDSKRWHRSAQAVVWAGSQALRQANLLKDDTLRVDEARIKPREFGAYIGTGLGGSPELIEIMRILDRRTAEREELKKHKKEEEITESDFSENINPFAMLHLLPGRVDEVPAMVFNAKAFNETFGTECAAGLASINAAVNEIKLGRAAAVLAGGVETAAHPATIWAFETLKALNKTDDPNAAPRPFSRNPGGLILGEGAAVVVLEPLDRVLDRQRRTGSEVTILAEILGTGKSSDAHHDTLASEEGPLLAIDRTLDDAGFDPSELTELVIQAHATSTTADAGEIVAIAKRFRQKQLAGITSIKGFTGHTFGASGAFNAIAGALSIRDNIVTANRNLDDPVPESEGYPMVPHRAIRVQNIAKALIHSFGFGGKNRAAILGPGEQKAV